MKLVDLIVYPQLLEAAGYTVVRVDDISHLAEGGVRVMGSFVRYGIIVSAARIEPHMAGVRKVRIRDQTYAINLSADGSFWLGDHTEVSDADHEATR